MSGELLDETMVVAYLTNRGIISGGAEVAELSGRIGSITNHFKNYMA